MKLLMTADTVGGVWTYALQLARAIGEYGVTVELATMGAPLTVTQRREAAGVPGLRVWASDYKLEWMDDPWDDVKRAGEWLLSLERCVRPDVVHLNSFCHAVLPWHAPVLVVGHSCVLSWWEAVKHVQAPAQWDRYRTEVRRGLAAASLVVTPTRAMLDALERHYGPLRESGVISNARDASSIAPGKKEPYILSAGRLWDEAKNVAALGRIASEIPWPIYVAGAEEHPAGGRACLQGLRALGYLDPPSMAKALARASIYALPARYEPFGLSALEAALAGCALVLGDIDSLREVWEDAAIFVPPDDHHALEAALTSLIEDPDHLDEHARNARLRALRYAPPKMALAYMDVYLSLIAQATNHTPTLLASG